MGDRVGGLWGSEQAAGDALEGGVGDRVGGLWGSEQAAGDAVEGGVGDRVGAPLEPAGGAAGDAAGDTVEGGSGDRVGAPLEPAGDAAGDAAAPMVDGPEVWAGVPLSRLPALGFDLPSLDPDRAGWRAPLSEAVGFAELQIFDDAREARQIFAFQRTAAATRALPSLALAWADEAAGDGAGMLLARKGNVVLLVRHHEGAADDVARDLIEALVLEVPDEPGPSRGALRWDAVGRPR